jgi:hypothetical protein
LVRHRIMKLLQHYVSVKIMNYRSNYITRRFIRCLFCSFPCILITTAAGSVELRASIFESFHFYFRDGNVNDSELSAANRVSLYPAYKWLNYATVWVRFEVLTTIVCEEFFYIRRDSMQHDWRLVTFGRNKLPASSWNQSQNMDVACPPETSIKLLKIIQCHIPEDRTRCRLRLHICRYLDNELLLLLLLLLSSSSF